MKITDELKRELITEWIAALRSGTYPQSIGQLQDAHGYCCLGVMCDIAHKKGVEIGPNTPCGGYIAGAFPSSWANGLDPHHRYEFNPVVTYNGQRQNVSTLNDDGVDFLTIADLLEEEYRKAGVLS